MTFASEGESYYANTTPATPGEKELVMSFNLTDVEIPEGTNIGFAIGTQKEEGRMYGNGYAFVLKNTIGVTVLEDNNSEGYLVDSVLNKQSVFAKNSRIKAVFDVDDGVFTLLMSVSEDSPYKEVFSMKGLTLPQTDVYCGLQVFGEAKMTFYKMEIYNPNLPQNNAIERYALVSGGYTSSNGVKITETEDGYQKMQVVGTTFKADGEVANSPIGSMIPEDKKAFVMNEGEVLAIVVEDVQGFNNPSNKTLIGMNFRFAKSIDNPVGWAFDNNPNFTAQFESGRFNYLFNPDGLENLNQTMGDIKTLYDVTEKGSTIMAVYDPYKQIFYMYTKAAAEPDFTLILQVNLTDLRWDLLDWNAEDKLEEFSFDPNAPAEKRVLYGALRFTGDLEITYKSAYTVKLPASSVGSNIVVESDAYEAVTAPKGDVLYAEANGYYGLLQDPVTLADNEALAIEYEVEGVSFVNGSYNIGFITTKDKEMFNKGELIERADAKITVVGDGCVFDEDTGYHRQQPDEIWSMTHYKGSNDLTPGIADTTRTVLFSAGNSIRVLIYNNGINKIQYKMNGSYTWNDFHTETDCLVFGDEPVYIALRPQVTYSMDFSKLKFYKVADSQSYDAGIMSNGDLTMDSTASDIRFAYITVAYSDINGGNIYLTGNDRLTGIAPTTGSLYADSYVTLVAEVNEGYHFNGWYLDGELVTKDLEYEVYVESSATYYASYTTSSYLYVENGYNDYWSSHEAYFADNSYVGISPERENGYDILGWDLSIVEYDEEGNKNVLEYYTIIKKNREFEGENLLNEDIVNAIVSWGSIVNNRVQGDSVTYVKENENHLISFGSFNIIDRKGFENNIIFKMPSVKSDMDAGITRRVEVKALYEKNDAVIKETVTQEYGPEWQAAFDKTFSTGMLIVGLFALGTVILIVIKIIVVRRKAAKKKREDELLKQNDEKEISFGASMHEIDAQNDTNDAEKQNNDK